VTVAVAVLAVLVVVLTVLLVLERRRASTLQQQLTASNDRHRAATDGLQDELASARERAETAERDHQDGVRLLAEAGEERERATARAAALEHERDQLTDRLAGRDRAHDELAEQVDALELERQELTREVARLTDERAALTGLRADDVTAPPPIGADADVDLRGPNDETLWALELNRSERTWRHSVAPIPLGPSPFTGTDDPLRVAVEVEAAALREEVGAPLEVRWDATVQAPARSLLVLRLAQELLAAAARESHAAVLEVRGSDEIVLQLRGDDDGPVAVELPPVPPGLVTIEVDDGLRIVVHGD
jgi:hypothetical protein